MPRLGIVTVGQSPRADIVAQFAALAPAGTDVVLRGCLDGASRDEVAAMAQAMLAPFPPGEYPNLVEFITDHAMQPGFDHGSEFEYGLDLLLDGLERVLADR